MSGTNLPKTEEPSANQIEKPEAEGEIVSGTGSEEIDTKDFELADEDSPLAQETGETGHQDREVNREWLSNFLAEEIYSENSAVHREQNQNAETACIKAAKLRIRNHPKYGEEWLHRRFWVDAETGETVTGESGEPLDPDRQEDEVEAINDGPVKLISFPRSLEAIVEAARDIGYDPTIEITLFRDDRKIVFEDNGIGMTAREYAKAYNVTGNSGTKLDSEAGGMFGAGELTFGNYTGKDGEMIVTTHTRRPDASEKDHEGIKALTYLGGFTEMDNSDIPDDFRGTRKEMPIRPVSEDGPRLDNIQEWTKEYSETLRVPVLYREFENGETVVKEEYGGNSLVDRFTDDDGNEPPIVLERPGEFTAIAGPDLDIGNQGYSSPTYPDTWLVSMPIDRNTKATVKSFWKVAVQIHNEQGICVHGPHRGMLKEQVDEVHEDDIFTPTPTGTRDALTRDQDNKEFFEYVSENIKEHELSETEDIVESMIESDHPAEAVRENPQDWTLFHRMVEYYESSAKRSERQFKNFVDENDALPDVHFVDTYRPKTREEVAVEKIYSLFTKVSHAPNGINDPKSKNSRSRELVGNILSNVPAENVYMAASTGGNFTDQRKVVRNTHDDWDVLVLGGAHRYSWFEDRFGFTKLKTVPVTQGDDHDFDVPVGVHDRNVTKKKNNGSGPKPDQLKKRTLKIRDSGENTSIDKRWTIDSVIKHLKDGGTISGSKMVLFPGGQDYENISDHYDLQKYAAIASCSQSEYEKIKEATPENSVFTYEEFKDWSLSTVIATEKGGRQVRNLLRDGEFIVLTYGDTKERKRLLADENETLRGYYKQDVLEKRTWTNDEEKPDPVFAVADAHTLNRAEFGLKVIIDELETGQANNKIRGLYFSYNYLPIKCKFRTGSPSGKVSRYKAQAETPNWQDDSRVYENYVSATGLEKEFLRGCHEAGFDPTLLTEGEVERIVGQIDTDELAYYGNEPDDGSAFDDTEKVWVVSEWHHDLHHRSDPRAYFDNKEDAEQYAAENHGDYRVDRIMPGETDD